MKDIVLASYRTNTEADIEADLIVNNEACSFVELLTIGEGVQAIDDGINQLMQHPEAKDVLILHGGSLQRICDELIKGLQS